MSINSNRYQINIRRPKMFVMAIAIDDLELR